MNGNCRRLFSLARRWSVTLSLVLSLGWALAPADVRGDTVPLTPPPTDELLLVHPDLPPLLPADRAVELGLFTEVPGLRQVSFWRAPWGGVLARLEIQTSAGPGLRLRNLPPEEWDNLQARVAAQLAGREPPAGTEPPVPGSENDPAADLRAWPEVPLVVPPPRPGATDQPPSGYPPLKGRWQAILDVGVRTNISDFDNFFTPMGQVGVAFGYAPLERVIAQLGFTAGFGDMRRDFEDRFGDGRTNSFAFSLGVTLRQPLSRRTSLYAQLDGGYYIRSLFWGGAFVDPSTGRVTNGVVLEQRHWGYQVRAGIMFQRAHKTKPRFFDIGIGLQSTPAELWDFWDETQHFTADDRDRWIALTVRFWDTI